MPTLVSQLLQSTSKQPAIIFNDTEICFESITTAAKRLATALIDHGIEKGDRVAILLPNVPHFCISYYATLMARAIAVPLNFMHDSIELGHQLSDSGAKILITWQSFLPQILQVYKSIPTCKDLLLLGERISQDGASLTQLIAESKPLDPIPDISETDSAVLNYTSGISDTAMGAELTHGAIANNATTCIDMFNITDHDKQVAVLPLFHPLGQTLVMHASFVAGAPLVLLPRFKPQEVIKAVHKSEATFIAAVPGMFRALNEAQGDPVKLPSLKYCMSYGGPLPKEILVEFENKFDVALLKAYGLTEAGPLVSSTRLLRDRKSDSAGLPLLGVEVQIRDAFGTVLHPNQSGEIYVKSPSLMKGYYNKPEETVRRLQDGWLATGDIGYLDLDHYLFIQERKDDIITKGGFAIYSREVERVILDHDAVEEAAVIGVSDAMHGAEVKAFVVLKKDARLSEKELYKYCQDFLPIYKCPKYMESVSSLPKSPTGRVLKRYLRQLTVKSSH